MKKNVTIGVNPEIWASGKEKAWFEQKSMGKWVEDLISDRLSSTSILKSSPVTPEEVLEQSVEPEMSKEELQRKNDELHQRREEAGWSGGYSKNQQLGRGRK